MPLSEERLRFLYNRVPSNLLDRYVQYLTDEELAQYNNWLRVVMNSRFPPLERTLPNLTEIQSNRLDLHLDWVQRIYENRLSLSREDRAVQYAEAKVANINFQRYAFQQQPTWEHDWWPEETTPLVSVRFARTMTRDEAWKYRTKKFDCTCDGCLDGTMLASRNIIADSFVDPNNWTQNVYETIGSDCPGLFTTEPVTAEKWVGRVLCPVCENMKEKQGFVTVTERNGERRDVCEDCKSDYIRCTHKECATPEAYYIPRLYDINIFCHACNDAYTEKCARCNYRKDKRAFREGVCLACYLNEHGFSICPVRREAGFQILRPATEPLEPEVPVPFTMPGGIISTEGKSAILDMLCSNDIPYYALRYAADMEWIATNNRGNLSKRIAAWYHRLDPPVKLSAKVLSAIGDLASQHSSNAEQGKFLLTADLNRKPEYFCHKGSCWWGGGYESRCVAKHSGTFGLLIMGYYRPEAAWKDEDRQEVCTNLVQSDKQVPVARCWIQPVDGRNQPTMDMKQNRFMVYNAYNRSGLWFARLWSQQMGLTYKSVVLSADYAHINNNRGHLLTQGESRETEIHWNWNKPCDCRKQNND